MSHPFGDLLAQFLHRKHGLNQSKLAAGILQSPSIVTDMAQGKRLRGPQARERVIAIIGWLHKQGALDTLEDANGLLSAAGMANLSEHDPAEAALVRSLHPVIAEQQPIRPTSAKRATNLPAQLTSFIGRRTEIAEIDRLLDDNRLVTLTGAGGVGKTRLALRVAMRLLESSSDMSRPNTPSLRFTDGIWLVEFASVADPDLVVQTINTVLRLIDQPNKTPHDVLVDHLTDKHVLLVLDNCEHLIESCAQLIERLLQQCWNLHVLATSRELLRIPGEASYRVPPLTLPKNNPNQPEAVLACDAAQLFVERTRALNDPSFSLDKDTDAMAIAQICQCLDGIPLALELAASLTRVMALDEVAAHLGNDLSSPTNQQRTAISRHYTMEQALTWSYDLLTSVEQQLLARLSVFSGGWTLEAAREVCGGTAVIPLLDQLVLKSLVILDRRSGTLRYRFLEPIRQFAHAHLLRLQASGELDELRLLHIRYYTKLAEQVSPRMQERPALDNLELEHDNFRAVLSCSLTSDPEPGLRLITALGEYWRIRGHLLEGWRWAQSLLKQGGQTDPTVLAAALASASMLAYHLGQHSQSKHMGREALALARQIGDPALLAWSSHSVGLALSQSVTTEKEHQEAESFFDGALSIFRAQHNTLGIAKSIGSKGEMARLRGDIEGATVAYREALDLFSQLGNSVGMSVSHLNLGWVSQRLGDDLGAEEHFRKSLTLARQIADQDSIINALAGLAALTVKAGELERAAQLIGAIETQQLAYGNPFDATDWADYEPFIVTARTQMALSVFDLRREEGSRLTLEQAIDYALNYPQRTAPSLPDCA